MGESYPSVEEVLRHVRKETRELADQLMDGQERATLWAFMAAALIGKVIECLPEMEVADASEARVLVGEAREFLRSTLENLRLANGGTARARPGVDPSLS